jgi:hypothetical protein
MLSPRHSEVAAPAGQFHVPIALPIYFQGQRAAFKLAYRPMEAVVGVDLWLVTGENAQRSRMGQTSITTAMNVYGMAMPSIKRKANSRVVSMVLKKHRRRLLVAAS